MLFSDLIIWPYLVGLSISKGVFPSNFKQVSVSPILKKPNLVSHEPANYRPIPNLNISKSSKIIKRLFSTRLQPHIVSSPNFNSLQSAYRRYHSIATSLVHSCTLRVYHAADDEQLYFFLWLSAQPLILSIIKSFSSASLTPLVSWDHLIIGPNLIYLVGLTLCE